MQLQEKFVGVIKIRRSASLHDWQGDSLGTRDRYGVARPVYLALILIAVYTSVPPNVWGQGSRLASRTPAPRSAAKNHAMRKQRGLQISKIIDPNNREAVGSHSQGEAVIRAAILLDRLKFSPGEISKSYGNNLRKAIQAFQSASGLPSTGDIDSVTWAALNDDQGTKGQVQQKQSEIGQNPPHPQQNTTPQSQAFEPKPQSSASQGSDQGSSQGQSQTGPEQPGQPESDASQTQALTTYIIALEDVTGPFTPLPRIRGRDGGERRMLREAKFARLNYESPLELLAEKFHSSPHLLVELNPGRRFNKAGEKLVVPNVLTPDPAQAASVIVDGSVQSVTALDSSGKILAFYPATVGSEHDPLPVGNWSIDEVTWYPKFNYNPNRFWDAENKKPRATLPPGPRNPVGAVWIRLSKKHYGVHGTPEPSRIGITQSHGCIRLTNWDAAELGKIVRVGTPVIIHAG
jgi:lipoprotein-anchoring transpeptidase ErfK/SrfK/peptidoglycan hydrolase-like protein with peptidoglycan-binding domain